MSTSRNSKLTWWIVLLGTVGVIWAVLPLLLGDSVSPPASTTPASPENTWVPEAHSEPSDQASAPPVEPVDPDQPVLTTVAGREPEPLERASESPEVHSEEEPAVQPRLSAIPPETPTATLDVLAEAVEARLAAELTGEGRADLGDVAWRNEPCCAWVTATGLVADFSNPDLVRVVVEWETDLGVGSGPTYWTPDGSGGWSPAVEGAST